MAFTSSSTCRSSDWLRDTGQWSDHRRAQAHSTPRSELSPESPADPSCDSQASDYRSGPDSGSIPRKCAFARRSRTGLTTVGAPSAAEPCVANRTPPRQFERSPKSPESARRTLGRQELAVTLAGIMWRQAPPPTGATSGATTARSGQSNCASTPATSVASSRRPITSTSELFL